MSASRYSLRFRFAGDEDFIFNDTKEWIKDYIKTELFDYRLENNPSAYNDWITADSLYYIYSHSLIKRSAKLERKALREELKRNYGICYKKYNGIYYFHITSKSVLNIISS